jgi:hypothetical protein
MKKEFSDYDRMKVNKTHIFDIGLNKSKSPGTSKKMCYFCQKLFHDSSAFEAHSLECKQKVSANKNECENCKNIIEGSAFILHQAQCKKNNNDKDNSDKDNNSDLIKINMFPPIVNNQESTNSFKLINSDEKISWDINPYTGNNFNIVGNFSGGSNLNNKLNENSFMVIDNSNKKINQEYTQSKLY